jgi:hypothetical protein
VDGTAGFNPEPIARIQVGVMEQPFRSGVRVVGNAATIDQNGIAGEILHDQSSPLIDPSRLWRAFESDFHLRILTIILNMLAGEEILCGPMKIMATFAPQPRL